MLVLSRQKDQSIYIGDDIEVYVAGIKGDKVRLGIRAPTHVPVHRKEIYDAMKREQIVSGRANPIVESLAGRNAQRQSGELEETAEDTKYNR